MARKLDRSTLEEVGDELEVDVDQLPRTSRGGTRWDQLFGSSKPLRVEIGVGNSPFLIELAKRSPDYHYLGFEYSQKRVAKFLKMVRSQKADNIRVLRLNATLFLDRLFELGSIDHFYINHPDPWPKRRHAKKRFLTHANAVKLRSLLRNGGGLSLRTDFPAYAQQMLDVLDSTRGMSNLAGAGSFALSPLEGFSTPYESRFRRSGRQIYYLEYTRTGSS